MFNHVSVFISTKRLSGKWVIPFTDSNNFVKFWSPVKCFLSKYPDKFLVFWNVSAVVLDTPKLSKTSLKEVVGRGQFLKLTELNTFLLAHLGNLL